MPLTSTFLADGSYCYILMIGYWHHRVVRLSVRPSVCLSVCNAVIVALRVGVEA